jgi:outer membrane protein OmpA-like peptidoglycan-associated protein
MASFMLYLSTKLNPMLLHRYLYLLFIILFYSVIGSAQSSKKVVILYNVVPTSVELVNDGTIKTFYGRADHFFQGYQLVQRDQYFSEEKSGILQEKYEDVIVSTDIKYLSFYEKVATLNKETIQFLDQIKNALFQNPERKVMLTPYRINENSKTQVILLKNRLASCLSYLDIMGVSKDRIAIDSKTQDQSSGIIHASIIIKSSEVK